MVDSVRAATAATTRGSGFSTRSRHTTPAMASKAVGSALQMAIGMPRSCAVGTIDAAGTTSNEVPIAGNLLEVQNRLAVRFVVGRSRRFATGPRWS